MFEKPYTATCDWEESFPPPLGITHPDNPLWDRFDIDKLAVPERLETVGREGCVGILTREHCNKETPPTARQPFRSFDRTVFKPLDGTRALCSVGARGFTVLPKQVFSPEPDPP